MRRMNMKFLNPPSFAFVVSFLFCCNSASHKRSVSVSRLCARWRNCAQMRSWHSRHLSRELCSNPIWWSWSTSMPRSSSTSATRPRTIFWARPSTPRHELFFSSQQRQHCFAPIDKKIFVADPAAGSKHNRGCAVDLSLYDLKTGKEVKMPSGYDEMTDRAFADYDGGTPEERARRALLRQAMEKQGFQVNPKEWWHFDYKDWNQYPILNMKFEDLGQ